MRYSRALIDGGYIPDDVKIQVLVQSREHLIRKTFDAIKGAKNVIFHFYNSTSALQRKVVFNTDKQGVTDIAVNAAKLIKQLGDKAKADGTNIIYEYSPESFMGTETDFAAEICAAVMDALDASESNKVILNPALDRREQHAESFCRSDRIFLPLSPPPRARDNQLASAQRPRNGSCCGGARNACGRGTNRGHCSSETVKGRET